MDGQGRYADRQQHPLPCLVLLDLNMPGKSGFEVLRWIRQHPPLKSLKVVVVSGSNQETDIETAQRLGATDDLVMTIALTASRPPASVVPVGACGLVERQAG